MRTIATRASDDAVDEVAAGDLAPLPEHPVLTRLQTRGSLGLRVRRGIAWSATSRLAIQVASLGSQVVLARLLLPSDYGLVALATVLNGLAALMTELGLTAAVVQSRRLTERLLCSALWLNALSGVVVTGVVIAIAPLVADFYGDDRITLLVQVSALAFVLNVAAVPMALLQRALRFKTLGSLEVWSSIAGLASTVALAALGAGAVSLAVGPLVRIVVMDVLVWATVRWRPRAGMHRAEVGELWRFGGGLTGSNALAFASRNVDTVLLGRAVSAVQVGLYNRSYEMMMMPLTQVSSVLSRVLLPAFSEMQTEPARLRAAWTTTLRVSMLFGVATGLGVAACAPALVETLYGERWLGMVTTLSLLAASIPPQLVGRNLGPLFQALGRTGQQFRLTVVTTVITVVAVLVGLPWGITGVAIALLVKSWLSVFIPLLPAMRLIEMTLPMLWRASRGSLVAGTVMVAAVLGLAQLAQPLPPPAVLVLQVVSGGLVYAVGMWLFERETARALVSRVRRRRSGTPDGRGAATQATSPGPDREDVR